MTEVAPYGAWRSPITAAVVAAGSVGLGQIVLDGADVYWVEQRSAEGGRNVIVRRTPDGRTEDVTPAPFNARTRVHEYGGGAYTVSEGEVVFANFGDQRLYRVTPDGTPAPLTPEGPWRYADLVVDRRRGLLFCVCEYDDHPPREGERAGDAVVNAIVAVPLSGGVPRVLVADADFCSNPRLSPDGRRLAWLSWSHPNMPWDGTQLRVAELTPDATLGDVWIMAGSPTGEESIFQPEWGPDGALYFVSDRTGWWNLYRGSGGGVEALHPREAEFATPQWVFGMATYGFVGDRTIAGAFAERGTWRLGLLDLASWNLETLDLPYTSISGVRTRGGEVYFIGASPAEGPAVLRLDIGTRQAQVLKRASEERIDPGYVSVPQTMEFPTEAGRTAFGFFYPPHNQDFTAPQGERPPLLVMSHGGPTGATTAAFRPSVQYWTSRGIAVLDVNYGGSTGYGRAYRDRLRGQWGIVDVQDCANGARYLAQQGLVDPERLAITGGSAGGFTTLAALTFTDVFKAGASYYGISDLEALAIETHKFESRYLDRLVAPYPEGREVYLARSPIHHTDRLASPMIILQGLEDRVVPPNQAEMMVAALRARGLPVAYLTFEGEQHGFRRAENIQRALEAELYFYSRIFGFELADPVDPITIENL